MTPSDLPPGCSVSDIPGNRPEDVAWEAVHEAISDYCTYADLTPEDADFIWTLGASIFEKLLVMGVSLPHDEDVTTRTEESS